VSASSSTDGPLAAGPAWVVSTATIAGQTVAVSQGITAPFDRRVARVDGNLVTLRRSWDGPPRPVRSLARPAVPRAVEPNSTASRTSGHASSVCATFATSVIESLQR
jgi:hypothetical protein